MTRLVALLLVVAGFALWYRYSLPIIRRDLLKFRAWRHRLREWSNAETTPPTEYRRDNLLWTVRLASLIICALAFVAMTVLLFVLERPPLGAWALAVLTIVCFVGAGIWGAMNDSVR